jgi:hypothetical protein
VFPQGGRAELTSFVEMRSLLCERLYQMTLEPQRGRRNCQQLPFFYLIGRLASDKPTSESESENVATFPEDEYGTYRLAMSRFIGWPQLKELAYKPVGKNPHGARHFPVASPYVLFTDK